MYTNDELKDIDQRQLEEEIAELEDKIDKTIVDTNVLDEYRKRVEEHAARSADLGLARAEATDQKRHYKELSERRLKEFNEGMTIINEKLKDMYRMITMGGNAELDGGHEPFDEGIQFRVKPPRKGWNHISNLSGGEKTLSSLALVFALHYYKPTPLYVMDEIDAALDFRNVCPHTNHSYRSSLHHQVSIVANYIKERTKNAQFIVISLRNNMFELAARLVGVYKVNQMVRHTFLSRIQLKPAYG
jgi:structural maintenance of chromosome 4